MTTLFANNKKVQQPLLQVGKTAPIITALLTNVKGDFHEVKNSIYLTEFVTMQAMQAYMKTKGVNLEIPPAKRSSTPILTNNMLKVEVENADLKNGYNTVVIIVQTETRVRLFDLKQFDVNNVKQSGKLTLTYSW